MAGSLKQKLWYPQPYRVGRIIITPDEKDTSSERLGDSQGPSQEPRLGSSKAYSTTPHCVSLPPSPFAEREWGAGLMAQAQGLSSGRDSHLIQVAFSPSSRAWILSPQGCTPWLSFNLCSLFHPALWHTEQQSHSVELSPRCLSVGTFWGDSPCCLNRAHQSPAQLVQTFYKCICMITMMNSVSGPLSCPALCCPSFLTRNLFPALLSHRPISEWAMGKLLYIK